MILRTCPSPKQGTAGKICSPRRKSETRDMWEVYSGHMFMSRLVGRQSEIFDCAPGERLNQRDFSKITDLGGEVTALEVSKQETAVSATTPTLKNAVLFPWTAN